MAMTISASVGRNGVNKEADVITVQSLLNQVPATYGGALPFLDVDGKCGPLTIGAIQRFQLQHFGWSGADGRVDPGQQTLAKLNEYGTAPGVVPPVIPPPPPPELTSMDFLIVPSYQADFFPPYPTAAHFTYSVLDVKNNLQRIYQLQVRGASFPALGPFQGWFARFRPLRATGVSGFEGTGVYMTSKTTNPGPPSKTTIRSTLNLFSDLGGTGISIEMKTHLLDSSPIPGTGGTMSTSMDGRFKLVV